VSQVIRTGGSGAAAGDEAPTQGSARPQYVVGEIIAEKYKLVSQLGEGGMGALWVAKNVALDAHVALKLIRADVTADSAEERFLTEARAAARLKHPSIVRVFDFGRSRRNEPFIVMELLHGESLGEVLDREKRVPATYAVQVLLPIADALAAAHAKDVIHRDLKPDNIFLAESDGRVVPKILDFGIAKLQGSPVTSHRITQAGTVVGSPDYLSPEQARGMEDIDHRADVWSFCVLLYECIVGHVPFEEAAYNALLRHIIEDEVPSILDHAAGDAELWAIMQKGFAKRREDRFQNMRALGEALATWLLARGITEDVTGHALRAAWMEPSASYDHHSRPSLPGYRASNPQLSPSESETGRPPSLETVTAAPEGPAAPHGRIPAILLLLALAGLAGYVLFRYLAPSPPKSADATTAVVAPAPAVASESVAPTVAPPQPMPELAPSEQGAKAPPRAPGGASGRRGRAAKPLVPPVSTVGSAPLPSPGPSATGKPKGAYGEDLGF